MFPKRIKLVRKLAERHADDRDDDVGNGRPDVPHLNEELQTEVVDEDIDYSYKEIPYNLRPTPQRRARETDMPCHPEARQKSDGEFEHKGCNMRRKGNEIEVKDLAFENEMIEHIVQHPLQSQVQSSAGRITEQLKAHHLAERRIKEVDDLGQSAFNPKFYVFQG